MSDASIVCDVREGFSVCWVMTVFVAAADDITFRTNRSLSSFFVTLRFAFSHNVCARNLGH